LKAFLFVSFLILTTAVNAQSHGFVLSEIKISGNDKTRERVVLRELPFKVGDSITLSDTNELRFIATQNLNNTLLFNFVDVFYRLDDELIRIEIVLDERWYIWPSADLSLGETNLNSWWRNKDFSRINYAFLLEWLNTTGRRDKLTFDIQGGWTRKTGLIYSLPNLGKRQNLTASIDLYYANNKEVNYGSINNERLFFRGESYIQEEISTLGSIEYRPALFNSHRFSFGQNTAFINDTILDYNPNYLFESNTQSRYLRLGYRFRRERRENLYYPLQGYLFDIDIEQNGLGILRKNDLMLSTAYLTYNWYKKFSSRWYFAYGIKSKVTFYGEPPYYNQRAIGYENQVIRGYHLYVIDGQHYGLWKSNLKYQLVKKKVVDLKKQKFKRFDKFHYSLFMNAFADAAYVVDNINANTNPFANKLQYGYGIGLDFVSYYDLVIRFEGSMNRAGKPGFAIYFTNPI
jgi:outer membrane protein assembly factor BamA